MAVDSSSIVAAFLFFLSNILNVSLRVIELKSTSNFNWQLFRTLDPDYIRQQWQTRSQYQGLATAAGVFNAVAWGALCIPILQVAWILSRGGRRRLGLHLSIGSLVIAGSLGEMISRLMTAGMANTSFWIASSFNLSYWSSDGTNDGTGWRVLEIVTMITRGMLLWVDAFEWLSLFGVLILIFFSVRSEKQDDMTFGYRWATFGGCIGILCFFDFLADVLRFVEWRTFMAIALVISVVNTLILLPVWLILLGRQLPKARAPYDSHHIPHTLPVQSISDDVV